MATVSHSDQEMQEEVLGAASGRLITGVRFTLDVHFCVLPTSRKEGLCSSSFFRPWSGLEDGAESPEMGLNEPDAARQV